MPDYPETRQSLLIRVRDPEDHVAWEEFARLYRPVIYRSARAKAFQEADAQDVAQQVLVSVAQSIPSWTKQSAEIKFRHWLAKVIRHALIRHASRQPRDLGVGGEHSVMFEERFASTGADLEAIVETEFRRELYRRGSMIVRRDVEVATWRAFELTVVEGCTVADAAEKLGTTCGAVYASRSRVMKRLRDEVRRLEAEQ